MAELPDEVMTDILTRLPVKSLLRFRCVSKPFRDLIDGPYFIKRHLNRSLETKTNHKLILQHSCLFSVDLDTLDYTLKLNHPLLSDQFSTQILGSVNGLLCLYNGQVDIVIWNLATRNYRKIPVTEIGFPGPPDCELIVYGFGYDSVSDDYKLLRLVQFYGQDFDSFDSEAKVYSLRSNSWQWIKDFPYYLRYKQDSGKLACGALHWIVSRKHERDYVNISIAAFDLSTNEYRLVDLPEFSNKGVCMNVWELEGRLCLLCNYIKRGFVVWVMKDYGVKESWSNLFSVSQPEEMHSLFPLGYSKNGDEIMLVRDNKQLFWYNLKEGKGRKIKLGGCPKEFESGICVESLVPLGGKTGDYAKTQDGKRHKRSR